MNILLANNYEQPSVPSIVSGYEQSSVPSIGKGCEQSCMSFIGSVCEQSSVPSIGSDYDPFNVFPIGNKYNGNKSELSTFPLCLFPSPILFLFLFPKFFSFKLLLLSTPFALVF